MCLIAFEKCVGFTTIGHMELVLGNSMTMALLVEAEACRCFNERKTHTQEDTDINVLLLKIRASHALTSFKH